MSYLLDTNIVLELRKPSPKDSVVRWLDTVREDDLYLSVLTIGEIRQGVERLRHKDSVRAQALEAWLEGISRTYDRRIVPITSEIADMWGRLNVPDLLPVIDGLLAGERARQGLDASDSQHQGRRPHRRARARPVRPNVKPARERPPIAARTS